MCLLLPLLLCCPQENQASAQVPEVPLQQTLANTPDATDGKIIVAAPPTHIQQELIVEREVIPDAVPASTELPPRPPTVPAGLPCIATRIPRTSSGSLAPSRPSSAANSPRTMSGTVTPTRIPLPQSAKSGSCSPLHCMSPALWATSATATPASHRRSNGMVNFSLFCSSPGTPTSPIVNGIASNGNLGTLASGPSLFRDTPATPLSDTPLSRGCSGRLMMLHGSNGRFLLVSGQSFIPDCPSVLRSPPQSPQKLARGLSGIPVLHPGCPTGFASPTRSRQWENDEQASPQILTHRLSMVCICGSQTILSRALPVT